MSAQALREKSTEHRSNQSGVMGEHAWKDRRDRRRSQPTPSSSVLHNMEDLPTPCRTLAGASLLFWHTLGHFRFALKSGRSDSRLRAADRLLVPPREYSRECLGGCEVRD